MLCETEVGDLYVPVCAEKNVLRFEVSVNDVEGMEVIKRKSNLGSVELCN